MTKKYDNFTPKNMLVRTAWTGPQPRLTSLHWLGYLPSLALLLYKKKTSGTEVQRTPDVMKVSILIMFNC